ncbi:S-adenosylmethionine decarboxylase [Acrasis kona]|uniref:S-adenosylmethionine decarboxylase proenzyme n=1 Tax=Acrasis kona TaxID=1008807 RepID=A0AAW2ZDM5_9EUKA
MSCLEASSSRNHASIDYAMVTASLLHNHQHIAHITHHSGNKNKVPNNHPTGLVLAPYAFEGFEGPEKKISITFTHNGGEQSDLRRIKSEVWQQKVLDLAHCKIISRTSNEHFDAYVLSESSLFVYPDHVLLKTCGTTTLLYTIQPILELASSCNLKPDHIMYSRKNFVFPHLQPSPHSSFTEEVEYLNKFFAPHGSGRVVGPLDGDHWYLYMAQLNQDVTPSQEKNVVLEIMMHDLDMNVMKQFCRGSHNSTLTSYDISKKSGITNILPGSTIDAFQFEPCGYSMNGLLKQFYSTIHITPEEHCSFASYETNCDKNVDQVIDEVAKVFKPGRMTVTVMIRNDPKKCLDLQQHKVSCESLVMKQKCQYNYRGGYELLFMYYERSKKEQGQNFYQ